MFVRFVIVTVIMFKACITLVEGTPIPQAQTENSLSHLARQDSSTQLIVDNKPFLILDGELGNSGASSLECMKPIWPKLVQMNLNTVLAPVYWELMEPQEGKYDFTLIDGLIDNAREHNLRLVLLWFGSWKNSMSCYVPEWIKKDQQRFPRACLKTTEAMEIMSAFCIQAAVLEFNNLFIFFRETIKFDS